MIRSMRCLTLVCILVLTGCGPDPIDQRRSGDSPDRSSVVAQNSDKCRNRHGGNETQTLMSGGLRRSVVLHTSMGSPPTKGWPLILVFHGHESNASAIERLTRFSEMSDSENFIVAYPQGAIGPDGVSGWNSYGLLDPYVDDIGFTGDLIGKLVREWCVDARSIYAVGFSNGGGFALVLACRLSSQIAAVAAVAPAMWPMPGGCLPKRPVPIQEFHGLMDGIVPYVGSTKLGLPNVRETLVEWASRNKCRASNQRNLKAGVVEESWTLCASAADVAHYRLEYGDHAWPGAFSDRYSVDATALSWAFFQSHPLIDA